MAIFCPKIAIQAQNDEPIISDGTDFWYYILSASSNYSNMCITDINETGSGIVKFKIQKQEEGNEFQQWKLIKPVNAENDNVHFVNRATGNIIQTEYDYNGYYVAQSTDNPEKSNGWEVEKISAGQFKVSGIDSAGDSGYLNASSISTNTESVPESSKFKNSSYAWIFEKANWRVSIDEIDPFENVRIYTENKRIIVEGAVDYTVTHISGINIPKDKELPTGVYLVTIKGKTKSVLVK